MPSKDINAIALETLNRSLGDLARRVTTSKKILVVDDDPGARTLFSHLMQEKSFASDIAASGEEALQRMEAEEYGVVLTDKNMPGISGIELLKRIKAGWPQTEVLIITAYASVDSALEAIAEGAFDYIPKPPPSLDYVAEKLRGAQARYEFEIRFRAMVDFLGQSLLQHQPDSEQTVRERLLHDALVAFESAERGHVVVLGTVGLLTQGVEDLGFRVTTVDSLEEAVFAVQDPGVHVVLFIELEGHLDSAEVTRRLHRANPDVGVFVIARESDLNSIVTAIGVGVGDYLLRPLEDREMFGPRLTRLVERQQRIARYRYLLNTLKKLNLDMATWITWPEWG